MTSNIVRLWRVPSALILLLTSSLANAGYLIVKNVSCENAKPCLEPLPLNDPNRNELYKLLLDHTWPTAKDPSIILTEKNELDEALKATTLNERYQYIWIPDTLQDLNCASVLLEESDEHKLLYSSIDRKPGLVEYAVAEQKLGHPFSPNTDVKVQSLFEKRSHSSRDELDKYFSEFDQLGQPYFIRCNKELADSLFRHAPSMPSETKGSTPRVELDDLTNRLTEKRALREITRAFAVRYDTARDQSRFRGGLVKLPQSNSELDRAIDLEIESNKRNEALFFRGTNMTSTLEGGLALDGPFSNSPSQGNTKDSSLSYGGSLFAGLFRESSPTTSSGTACSMCYFKDKKFGYAVRIQRNNPSIKQLFEIPRLGLIGRLFASGEYFHPRSKVGIKGVTGETRVAGLFTLPTVKDLDQIELVVNPFETPEGLSAKINQYLADHAVLITQSGSLADEKTMTSAISAQRDLAARKFVSSPEYVKEVMGFVLRDRREETLEAAIGELGKIRERDRETVGYLVGLVNHPEHRVRLLALGSLKTISPGNTKIHLKIAETLADESSEIVKAAAEFLRDRPLPFDRDTSHFIAKILETSPPDHQKEIIGIYKRRNEPARIPPEIQDAMAKTLRTSGSSKVFKVAKWISPSALRIIIEGLRSPHRDLRSAAFESVPKDPENQEIVNAVLNLLNDEDRYLRGEVVSALDAMRRGLTPQAIVLLARAMGDEESHIRYRISGLLSRPEVKKTPEVYQELIHLLKSPNREIRRNVSQLLKEIDPQLSFLRYDPEDQMKNYLNQDSERKISEVIDSILLEEIIRAVGAPK